MHQPLLKWSKELLKCAMILSWQTYFQTAIFVSAEIWSFEINLTNRLVHVFNEDLLTFYNQLFFEI